MIRTFRKDQEDCLWDFYKVGNVSYEISPNTEIPLVFPLPSTFTPPKYLYDFEQAITLVHKGLDVSEYGVHFYMPDRDLMRFYLNFDEYLPLLKLFPCVLTPDLSITSAMPTLIKKKAVFRSRQIGQLMQKAGITVPITLQWEDETTYDFCFCDVPSRSIVSISTVGLAKKSKDSPERIAFRKGFQEAMKRTQPRFVLHYGAVIPECEYGNTEYKVYRNSHFLIDQFQNGKEVNNG